MSLVTLKPVLSDAEERKELFNLHLQRQCRAYTVIDFTSSESVALAAKSPVSLAFRDLLVCFGRYGFLQTSLG